MELYKIGTPAGQSRRVEIPGTIDSIHNGSVLLHIGGESVRTLSAPDFPSTDIDEKPFVSVQIPND